MGIGYGGCLLCKDKWNWKKPHYIQYSTHEGMFPLCEECYNKLTPTERLFYCKLMIGTWIGKGSLETLENYKIYLDRIQNEVSK